MDKKTDIELSRDMTLKLWLEYWFDVYAKRTVKQSTAVSYHGVISYRISVCTSSQSLIQTFFRGSLTSKAITAVLKAAVFHRKLYQISAV